LFGRVLVVPLHGLIMPRRNGRAPSPSSHATALRM
jgi:hypothetical protein